MAGAELSREGDLVGDRGLVGIGEIRARRVEAEDAVLAERDDALRARDQPDDQRLLQRLQLPRLAR
jgi:hypothetical protein